MKDFFKQCLEELEDVSGIRQLHWLRQSCEDQEQFDKRKNVLIEGMILSSQRFLYIPQEDQKKIIRKMMIEDQNYEAINSRTVHKWLDLHKNQFPFITEEEMKPQAEPAPLEVADKYLNQLRANIAAMETNYKLPTLKEIKENLEQTPKVETGRQKFVINDIEIWAYNQEEAQKAYNATFN